MTAVFAHTFVIHEIMHQDETTFGISICIYFNDTPRARHFAATLPTLACVCSTANEPFSNANGRQMQSIGKFIEALAHAIRVQHTHGLQICYLMTSLLGRMAR
jgi:hypothetical protein